MNQSRSEQSTLRWRKSLRSSSSGDNCVEVADAGHTIKVRDSKNPDGGTLSFRRREVRALAAQIRAGQLDL